METYRARTRPKSSPWVTFHCCRDPSKGTPNLFTGYLIAKTGSSQETQTVAENYEKCVFRQFGASEVIRHAREPGFMVDFFRSFGRIVTIKQRAMMAYRTRGN
ncbi:reverse transcriptase [Phytophthora megakarya]|uniref:Reverse transcriptase n=1 Tax=Phytophthora megakarya TaxID=4795 RepID=A0A225W5T9_9STRA|nr:reverse transcriptase [Phytophthora megakarya]